MFKGLKGGFFDFDKYFSVSETPCRRCVQYELELCTTTGAESFINNQKFNRSEGSIIFARPGDERFSRGSYKCLYLDFSCDDEDFSKRYLDKLAPFIIFDDTEFIRKSISDIVTASDEPEVLLAESLLKAIILKLYITSMTSQKCRSRYSENIARACMFISENFHSGIGINEIAEAASLSPSFTYVEFKKNTGLTPHEYLTRKRLEFARSQLIFTNNSVGIISTGCGFENPNYLNYIFKKNYGLTPLSYRKKFRQSF